MGRKIFVSYKYGDTLVQSLPSVYFGQTKVRDYVNELQSLIAEDDNIYKGENDNESLSNFKDSTIASKLRDKIYDSSVTVVLISKGMKDSYQLEKNQWIPWEVSYSLKELTRDGITSRTNAVLGVVLPDEYGSYEYFLTYDSECSCTNYNTPFLFNILSNNMFNIKSPKTSNCNGRTVFHDYFSYIHCVKWNLFKEDIGKYVDIAYEIKDNKANYNIVKSIE